MKLLTEKQVSELLGIPVPTLRTHRSRPPRNCEPIPFVKIGGLVRYSEEKIREYLERNSVVSIGEHRLARAK